MGSRIVQLVNRKIMSKKGSFSEVVANIKDK